MPRGNVPRSGRTALGGVLAAGSLALLWVACLVPSGWVGLTALAGLFPVVGVLAAGRGAGYLCWAASGLLGLILLPDKGVAVLYLLFFGLYPVVKSRLESFRRRSWEWGGKLIFFNAVLTLVWFLLREMFLPDPPLWMTEHISLLYLAGNLVFVIYDIGLSKLIALIQHRLPLNRR